MPRMAYLRNVVQQHVAPPACPAWLRSKDIRDAGERDLPEWSVESALGLMDAREIATAVLSVYQWEDE